MIFVGAIVVATVRRVRAYVGGAAHDDEDQDEPRDGAEREQPDVLAKGVRVPPGVSVTRNSVTRNRYPKSVTRN